MENLVNAIRDVLGEASFSVDGSLSYELLFEYFVAALVLCIVVSGVFKFLITLVKR